MSIIGRVHVLNVFAIVLSRLWYRTKNFSISQTIPKELEKILDFVWASKKHEINKDLLMSDISYGELRPVKIQNNKEFYGLSSYGP